MIIQRGYTVLELMVTLGIFLVILTLSWTLYHKYQIANQRTQMQGHLMTLAQQIQRHQMIHSYSEIDLKQHVNLTTALNYQVQLNTTHDGWQLQATPINTQAEDGIICINHHFQRYWQKEAMKCDFSQYSAW